jgi:hypothetical protein
MLKAGNSDRVLPVMGRADMIIPARQNAAVAKEPERKDIKMRELKFRVWCKGKSDNPNFNKQKWFDINDIILNKYFPYILNRSHDNFTAQQYTGLKDKNGKEIYEGDIIEWQFTTQSATIFIQPVVFSDGVFWAASIPLYEVAKNAEVIGNMCENRGCLK